MIHLKTANYTIEGKTIPKYKQASTGDYDLFAVWPYKHTRWTDQKGKTLVDLDKHNVGGSDLADLPSFNIADAQKQEQYEQDRSLHRQKTTILLNENAHDDLGNYTPRLAVVRFLLNEEIRAEANYLGGDMVHHGAESGRPFMDEVDLPFIVFCPAQLGNLKEKCGLIETIEDFRTFIEWANSSSYKIGLNPGWVTELEKNSHQQPGYYPKWQIQ